MNTFSIKTCLGILCIITVFTAMAENDNGQRMTDIISQKSSAGDIRGLLDTLPAIEDLWKQSPLAYLKTVKLTVPALRASSDPEVVKAALDTFSNVLNKTSPLDTVAATAYFELKDAIISDYCNLEEVRSNKARLLMIASFVGEIRSRRIAGYQNRGTSQPGRQILIGAGVRVAAELPNATLKEAYDKAVKQNEEDMKMNSLQLALFSADEGLTFLLTEYAKAFPATKSENRDFFQELITRAKLTAKEQTKLQAQN